MATKPAVTAGAELTLGQLLFRSALFLGGCLTAFKLVASAF